MDAYLEIAQTVLRSERRPLNPRAILTAAYRAGIVPFHLYGRTQYKTLGARLSEDLVQRNERSLFFRTAPGKFFLREFLTDESIPEEYRRPVPTRRRFRELILGPALAVDEETLAGNISPNVAVDPEIVLGLLHEDRFVYEDPRAQSARIVFCHSFVGVRRGRQILTYRLGRYREDRDAFLHRRCIGFFTLVYDFEYTLFNQADFGILDAGVLAMKIDLDIPAVPSAEGEDGGARLSHFIWVSGPSVSDLLAVIWFDCPSWFEPTRRRLALNDVGWIDDPKAVNNPGDFDPWSRRVLLTLDR